MELTTPAGNEDGATREDVERTTRPLSRKGDLVSQKPDRRRLKLIFYELLIVIPLVTWVAGHVSGDSREFLRPMLLIWALSIAVVDLLPIPTAPKLRFSLSFPLQLAVALIYSPPVAATVAFAGTSDPRELRRQISPLKALFIRGQIAVSVIAESELFHSIASIKSPWYQLGIAVVAATAVGYAVNVLLVAIYIHLDSGDPVRQIVRQMHVGIFGEFLLSYMGLAMFGVIIATFFVNEGVWSVAVFVAPMAFARQMFARTHSLEKATEELEVRQRENQYQAMHDSLTGLPNRILFLEELQQAIAAAPRGVMGVAVMIMDLDQFKEINDTLGHHYGDQLLREIGPRLQSVVRDQDTVARLGGDEFGVVLPDVNDPDVAIQVAGRVLDELERPLALEGLALDVSASIGIALYPDHSEDVDDLLRNADVAMYAAKESQAGFEVYSPERDQYSPGRLALLGQLRPAIENEQLILHYQPKADLADGGIRGVEALVRWEHPDRGRIQPDEFLPLIERTVLLRQFTMLVVNSALRQCSKWRQAGLEIGVAVNLSPRNLMDQELPEQVSQLLRRWSVPPFFLRFEITEGSLMADSIRSMDVLARLSRVGVGLSIDDFGTGYSSLSYLKRLPVDEIKIDRSFVINMTTDVNDATIVRATVDLSHNLGLRVVAEGVETSGAWEQLTSWGCDVAQGFYISPALPAEEVRPWIERNSAGVHRVSVSRGLGSPSRVVSGGPGASRS